jgi:molybdopterin molybdotransferase
MTNPAVASRYEVLSFDDAHAIVREYADAIVHEGRARELLPLLEAVNRVLAQPLLADRDQPPFPRATRDGFAGRAAEWAQGPLRVAGMVRAGEAWTGQIAGGMCVEIMTGAPVPEGADCVVMVEHVQRDGDTVALSSTRAIAAGDNIVTQGAEAARGGTLLAAGERIGAAGVAAAAGSGAARVTVWAKPRVAILATGDELVAIDTQPGQWQIRNSNTYSLAAQVAALGGEPRLYAPVPDDAEALRTAIAGAMRESDLLLLSGGVSMGRFDMVEPALEENGGTFRFTGVRLQPGRPLVFGTLRAGGLPFFGLPGNPVSTMVCFSLFVAPVLAALAGERDYALPFALAHSESALAAKSGLTRFLPAKLHRSATDTTVRTIEWQGSGDTATAARADCFVMVPEGAAVRTGDLATVLLQH